MDRITLIALLFSATGCVPIDGGAVEASWTVVTYGDGRGISDCNCACPPIAKVRLQLVPVAGGSDPCAGRATCQFSCNLQSGATRFDIPAGSYAISLVPVGARWKRHRSTQRSADLWRPEYRPRGARGGQGPGHPARRHAHEGHLRARVRRLGQQEGLHEVGRGCSVVASRAAD
jgi:hypothetical protein